LPRAALVFITCGLNSLVRKLCTFSMLELICIPFGN
jgi:hypothetical protein